MTADLVVSGLTVEYPTGDYVVRPLDRFEMKATDGSLVLLLGPSGCGKTSLLSALGAMLTPTSGSIRLGDVEITSLRGESLTRYRRRGVGIVFQAFNLVPSLDATENVMVPMRAAGVRRAEARVKALGLLEQMGLGDRVRHRPGDLSGGQQQRVAIARALANDPPLLLADEPTAHLDYVQVEGVLRIIRGLARPGRVVIVSTHDDRMLPLADHVVELRPHLPAHGVEASTRVELAVGSTLFRQGELSDLIYLVETGRIELFRVRPDGTEEPVRTAGPGDWFGEMGPTFHLPRSASARAIEPTVVIGRTALEFRNRQHSEQIGRDVT
jgi:putative ABC transport system ATP-binding protein